MLMAAAGAAGASALGSVTDSIGDGIAGIFGDTSTDRARKALTNQLLSSALAGDNSALVQLAYNAFDSRRGESGDTRTPIDGKRSPQDTRDLARKALQTYVTQRGGVPDELTRWASQLNAPIIPRAPTIVQRAEAIIRDGVTEGTKQAATQRVDDFTQRYGAWLAIGGLAVGGLILYKLARK